MPTTPQRPCRVAGCVYVVPCPVHPARRPWRDRPSFRVRYGTTWDALARRVLREEPVCRWGSLAGEGGRCGQASTTADHIVPRAWGGLSERANLRGLCARHQQAKASREGAAGGRR